MAQLMRDGVILHCSGCFRQAIFNVLIVRLYI